MVKKGAAQKIPFLRRLLLRLRAGLCYDAGDRLENGLGRRGLPSGKNPGGWTRAGKEEMRNLHAGYLFAWDRRHAAAAVPVADLDDGTL